MSSFVSGSNPTSSTICFIRRTMESPIRAWDWMMTKFNAVNRMRGVLIGGFSARRPSADHHGFAVLHSDPEVRDPLRARGPELHEFDRGEGLILVPPDRERGSAGGDLLAVCRLDTMAFDGGAVEDRVRDGDLLAASLPEHDGE